MELERLFTSVGQDLRTETIYIPLLEEGVPVYRPTQAKPLEEATFLVLPTPDYDPDIEIWEFPPGSVVSCEIERHEDRELLVARRLVRGSAT